VDKEERAKFLHDVDEFCQELRPIEEVCYVEHAFNDQRYPKQSGQMKTESQNG
jgi:hypothetical protein